MFYLQSRYYDPELGRFINADSQFDRNGGVFGYNLYAYCGNNPVMFKDVSGQGITLACVIIFGTIGAVVGGYIGYKLAEYYNIDPEETWKYVLGGIVILGATGALLGWGAGAAATAAAAKSASIALFEGRVVSNATMVIQLLQKLFEKKKVPMDLTQLKQLITLCQRYGLEIQAKIGDLVNVTNHKSWDGIPHIHVGESRIHVALTEEAVEYMLSILGLG